MVYLTNSFNGLALRDELVLQTIGGQHPAFEWVKYEQYNSPRNQIQNALVKALAEKGMDAGIALYEQLKYSHSPENFDELLLSKVGFALLGQQKYKEVIAVFELNAKIFPDSWRVYDSLGLAYMRNEKPQEAIKFYKKSLQLNPDNQRAKDAIIMQEKQVEKR